MTTTTHVVHRSWWAIYRTHGYFFREAAMLTIGLGVALHIYRVIFGDQLALKYAITPLTDRILLIPMTYAAVTGIALLARRRVIFANRRHRALFTGSVVYIAGSVPLHVYCSYIIVDTTLVTWFPMWFSYLLLIVVYPVFLTMFWRLHYRN
ncbi:hypothetical protein [Mycolicibacterium mageritense]|uniref:Uncharacterized protein n=2 Tax=Mycolicibacterium mageritense TaxID=53462 RepID=A0ABM7HTC0_MYCME|nr:hypothetical protein [Mycolicibacterium mageritense]MCC9182940.1 hypothetical protein [Mycolicibacterium mageritense]TXI58840.1 MAG: hypothetical protein E6Q55_22755 [Mycolicibacterium mageritense]BBX33815.1 hypothetical protein MMAGJ_30970 [Mycolicibacterium mageritense]GJJ19971.1 hypothetical protein MTY414_36440 [Mycolicibacterium mageritense]